MTSQVRVSSTPSVVIEEVADTATRPHYEDDSGSSLLVGVPLSQQTPEMAADALERCRAKETPRSEVEALMDSSLHALAEASTGEVDWQVRTRTGEIVVAAVHALRDREVTERARRELHSIIDSNIATHRGRVEYYPSAPVHDGLDSLSTEGWGSLEVAMWALAGIDGDADAAVGADVTEIEAVASLVQRASVHENMYVRQVSMALLAAVAGRDYGPPTARAAALSILQRDGRAVSCICHGLRDDLAQVRYYAAQAARALLDLCPGERGYLPELLPSLFISRHDAAEGVRRYAAINWRRAVGLNGRSFMCQNASRVLSECEVQSRSSSHEIRSAAVASSGEFALALPREVVEPFAKRIAEVLVHGMGDRHWAVLLAACNGYHDFSAVFPTAAHGNPQPSEDDPVAAALLHLTEHWISGVREAAAAALGAWARSFGEPASTRDTCRKILMDNAVRLLKRIGDEPVPEGLSKEDTCGPAQMHAFYNDVAVHTHQHALGCCSLDENHHDSDDDDDGDDDKKHKKDDDHNHHHDHDESGEPWQQAMGGVYLARETLRLWPEAETVDTLLPLLDDVHRARWYPHYLDMMNTLNQQVPVATEFVLPSLLSRPSVKDLSVLELLNRK